MKRILLLIMTCLLVFNVQAQHKKTVNLKPPRPKVGVVLGGGGAKGAAHIGVLKYLEEIGIPIDYVAGTSIGSIIGGLYAMGYSPDELNVLIANMNWSQYVGNSFDRSVMSIDMRERHNTMVVNIPFSLTGLIYGDAQSKVSFMPSAYVNNTALINLFNNLCVGYQKEMDFNDLPIPFACVATDIRTGKEIDIRYGSVPTAMRASMAIPGVFAPVNMDGHILVDGGLVNNFPADIVKEMGADIIIGVDVPDKDTIHENQSLSVLEVLNGLVNNAVNTKRTTNRELCDLVMFPDITGYGTLSFNHDAIDTLVVRGYHEAIKHKQQLLDLKRQIEGNSDVPLQKKLRNTKARNLADQPVFISNIKFNQSGNIKQASWLMNKGQLGVNQYITENDINRAVDIYRGTGAFDDITYNLIENKNDSTDSYTLEMNFKPTQPHIFGLGARYDTEEGAAMILNIGLNVKRLTGFKLNLMGRLSYNPRIKVAGTYSAINLLDLNLAYEYRSQHYKLLQNNGIYYNINYVQNKISAYISEFHLLNINAAIGANYTITSFDQSGMLNYSNDTINTELTTSPYFRDSHLLSPFVRFGFDNLDDTYFARRGISTTVGGHFHFDAKGSEKASQDISFSIAGYITPKNWPVTFIPQFYGRALFGKPAFASLWNTVGGEVAGRHTDEQMPFVGILHVDETSDWTNIARLDVRYNFYGKHYITAIYNILMGSDYGRNRTKLFNEIFSGAGLRYSYDSHIGPISLTGQWTDGYQKHFSAYFSLGLVF